MSNKLSINDLNSFIDTASESLTCNQECQKLKKEEELKKKLMQAKMNYIMGQQKIQQAEEKYMKYTYGQSAYDEKLEEDLTDKAEVIAEAYIYNFNQDVDNTVTKVDSYNSLLLNFKNVLDLYSKYKKENIVLFRQLKDDVSDVATNERKTFYEDQGIGALTFWYYILLVLYIVVVICFGVFCLIFPSTYSTISKIAVLLVLFILPFLMNKFFIWTMILVHKLYAQLPKNAYLKL